MGELSNWVDRLEEWLGRYLPNLAVAFVLFWVFLSISVAWHEGVGHVLTAKILGCEAGVTELKQIIGASSVDCSMFPEAQEMAKLRLISLAGPLLSFLLGLWIWLKEDPDHPIRLLAIILFFFSTIPSLFPPMKGSDMARAIEFGLSPRLGWLIFIFVTSVVALCVSQEIIEKKWLI